jgi:hypothetical protein
MTANKLKELKDRALKVREHIIRLSTDGGSFTGASLSCADLIVFFFILFFKITPKKNNTTPIAISCCYPKDTMYRPCMACLWSWGGWKKADWIIT